MGGGVCWLDYDGDGWLDLFVVSSYAERETTRWQEAGGLPESALYRNVEGKFVDVSAESGANLAVRGNGCIAADFDLDGNTDLYVTTARVNALMWNNGDGTFTEGAGPAGVAAYDWRSGAAVTTRTRTPLKGFPTPILACAISFSSATGRPRGAG